MLSRFFLRIWQGRGCWVQLLRPVAAIYGFLLRRKAAGFVADPAFSLESAPSSPQAQRPPIIVVGNFVVGGVGKTPIVMALLQHLQGQGYRPGVISRGYGRQIHDPWPVAVLPTSPAQAVGDEPLLIAQSTGVPVFVAAQRVAALQALCAAHPEVDIVLSDDGLQHWALPRELEIVVWDARGQGNGYLLPAGLLREPWPRQRWHPYASGTAMLHLYAADASIKNHLPAAQSWGLARKLADYALRGDGQRLPLANLAKMAAQNAKPEGRPELRAVAGIAQPENFFSALRAQGLELAQTQALRDHADLSSWWQGLPASDRAATWLCTQKDAVKLWAVCPQAWAVPLELQWPAEFSAALQAELAKVLPKKKA